MDQPEQHHGAATRLVWYARRVRLMSVPELVWRGAQAGRQLMPRRNLATATDAKLLLPGCDWAVALEAFQRGADRPLLLDRARAEDIAASHPAHVAAIVSAADNIVAGRFQYFGYPEARLSQPVDWNHDPVNQVRWPLVTGNKIDHRSGSGDPKWIWELNRLQHLPWLAQAWLFTGEDHFADLAFDHLDSWMEQNPPGRGISWRGGFEAGIRAISVIVALQALRDSSALTVARFERVVRMLAASADWCWTKRSRFSSANNHLVGELAGLATIAMAFPELASAARWERSALALLSSEAPRQILHDGASAEQAMAYQLFTTELLLVVAVMLRSRGRVPPHPISAAIDRSSDFLADLVGEHDPEPRYGDSDDGFALRLGPEPVRTIRDHLGLVGAFTHNDRAQRLGNATLSSLWMSTVPTGPRPLERRERRGSTADGSFSAPAGGLVVLRSAGRRLMMDVGPLGYLSIAAHGHADALAVTMSVDGRELIGEPGTASYYGHPTWRDVHRSTRVHATVTVDGQNQSVIAGPFMWTDHARVLRRHVDLERGIIEAEHDGYLRLPDPVTHRRWVVAPPQQSTVLVVDLVEGTAEHEMCVSWPLHPDLDLLESSRGHLVSHDGTPVLQIAYSALTSLGLDQVRGDADSDLGWWSDRLEAREPSWLLSCRSRGVAPLAVATLMRPLAGNEDAGRLSSSRIAMKGEEIMVAWHEEGLLRTVCIDRRLPGGLQQTSAPLQKSGQVR